jgi:hypothetical protein
LRCRFQFARSGPIAPLRRPHSLARMTFLTSG